MAYFQQAKWSNATVLLKSTWNVIPIIILF